MEKISIEKIPLLENPDKKLVRLLKEKGIEDSEAMEFLMNWTREQEELVSNSNESIQFNLLRTRLYFDAGYTEEAFENYEDLLLQVSNEGKDELYEEIIKERDEKIASLE